MHTRILIVAADTDSAKQLADAISRDGFTVTAVSGIEPALLQFGLLQPDLVVLDAPLQRGHGWDALERFRALSRVPLLVVNGPDNQRLRAESLVRGADDVMVRPMHSRELQARARALVRRAYHMV